MYRNKIYFLHTFYVQIKLLTKADYWILLQIRIKQLFLFFGFKHYRILFQMSYARKLLSKPTQCVLVHIVNIHGNDSGRKKTESTKQKRPTLIDLTLLYMYNNELMFLVVQKLFICKQFSLYDSYKLNINIIISQFRQLHCSLVKSNTSLK